MRQILISGLFLIIVSYLVFQVRKPSRWIGRPYTWLMNFSHSSLTDWGLKHVEIKKDFTILDVGCGGGRTIQKMAEIASEGRIFGVDYAAGSVAASRGKNARAIAAGRVDIQRASVSQLPFPDNKFDLVTAIETQYYWPDLENDMREILRVLKPGATLVIIAESYKGSNHDWVVGSVMKVLGSNQLSRDDQKELFTRAGYNEIEISLESSKGWICVTGKKP
jgi:ubiquinone/menaquinone biosynthesis C-methylase UbiE